MTSSRSRPKASRAWLTLLALLLLTGIGGVANAGRKRVVVLEFEGPKAEQFHEDVIRVIKKSHTVVSLDKWNGAAEEMSATKVNGGNIKKVAKKLKIDGVISGTIDKRRDEYILRLKLRSGTSGEAVGSDINIKSESAKLDSTATKDLSERADRGDQLARAEPRGRRAAAMTRRRSRRRAGSARRRPWRTRRRSPRRARSRPRTKRRSRRRAGSARRRPWRTRRRSRRRRPRSRPRTRRSRRRRPRSRPKTRRSPRRRPRSRPEDEEKPKKDPEGGEDEEEKPKKPKKVASGEEGEEGEGGVEGGTEVTPLEGDVIYSPSERFLDASAGLSFTARRMAFSYDPNQVTQRPAGYKSAPVPGAFFDITAFPLAYGHKRNDILRHLGATLMFDRVLAINSKNPNDGMKLTSAEQRFAIGGAFRYPLGKGAMAPVVGATLRYGVQKFTISGMAQIPNVSYSMFDLTGFFQYPLSPKMVLGASLAGLLPLGAGDITLLANYGQATLTGFEGSASLDYMITKMIFARAELRGETLGYAFKGEGMRVKGIGGARDNYFGGTLTAGFLY